MTNQRVQQAHPVRSDYHLIGWLKQKTEMLCSTALSQCCGSDNPTAHFTTERNVLIWINCRIIWTGFFPRYRHFTLLSFRSFHSSAFRFPPVPFAFSRHAQVIQGSLDSRQRQAECVHKAACPSIYSRINDLSFLGVELRSVHSFQ